jgi:sugar transferase (PEP-CTERM/EpsH1 system associated)
MPSLIRVRPFNLIRFLSERNHQITLLTLYENKIEQEEVNVLENYCQRVIALSLSRWRTLWNCLTIAPGREPIQTAYSWHPSLGQKLQEIVSGKNGEPPFDIIHIEHLRGVRYGLHLQNNLNGSKPYPPIVWDSVDCISHLFRQAADGSQSPFGRWVTRLELGRTEKYERELLHRFSRVLVTSPQDKKAFLSLLSNRNPVAPISVLPNGVDLDYFRPDEKKMREDNTIVVSGKMSYHANITMTLNLVENIMPRVWSQRPDVKVWIVGKNPTRNIQALEQHTNVTVTGTVPDIRPYLQRATVATAPVTYGAGIQNKVLEAMACATPTVASSQAFSALSAVAGRDLEVADDAETFSQTLLKLLEDHNRRQEVGKAGRSYIERNHDWANIAANLEEIYSGIVS